MQAKPPHDYTLWQQAGYPYHSIEGNIFKKYIAGIGSNLTLGRNSIYTLDSEGNTSFFQVSQAG